MSENNIKSAIEALLFSSEKPLTLQQLKGALDDLGLEQLRQELEGLKAEYESSNRGVRIAEIAGGYQMITASTFAPFLKKLYKERRMERLSKPALETLAIIAYKQPLTKLDIEALRGVNVDGVISSLLDKNMIRIAGRKKAPGRPLVFGTTRQFMEYFGLKSLDELPKMEDFAQMAKEKVEQEENLRALDNTEVTDDSQKVTQ
jgi:segregation and condensation protein B